jgi:DNA-binding transcriptional MerR regulator
MLSIGEVATQVGLRVSAVRYYEQRGLLPRVTRVANRRQYSTDHLHRLAFIRICQDAGLALDDIAVLVDPARPRRCGRAWCASGCARSSRRSNGWHGRARR